MFIRLPLSKKKCKFIAVDLSKKQTLDADPKAIQHINFIGDLDQAGNTIAFFLLHEKSKTVSDFSQDKINW